MSAPLLLGQTRFIYFIRAGALVKIGIADDPVARLAILRTSSPVALTLLGFYPGTTRLEASLHRRFSVGNSHGEWFAIDTPGLLEEIQKAHSYLVSDGADRLLGAVPVGHERGFDA